MGFESPDSLQISTRLGKPSSEHIPEATPTPETPPAAAAALPEQDELKISTRLQPRVADKPPVESTETTTVPEAAPTESTEPYIDPYGEWEDFRGHRLMGNGETEHEEFQIGQELTAKPELLKLLPELASIKSFKIVGFTDDQFVIVQIDGGKVRGYASALVRGYFELNPTSETIKEPAAPEPQPEEQIPDSQETLESATEAETSAEQEPLTQYLDIGDKVKIINETGETEEDWTIEDIYTMSLAGKDIERAVIINIQGTHRTIEMTKLETWNPAPEQPTELEAEPDRSFHEGEEVFILSEQIGELESGWHITYVSETVLGQKIFGFADVENADGVTKRIALSTLRTWNAEKKSSKPETTVSVDISLELKDTTKPDRYSAEWIAQTLGQFNIDPKKLEGFAELTDGQKALIVENFQSIMADEVEQRAATGLKQNKKFGIFGKVWRSTFKAVYMGKGREAALSGLETGDAALKETILKQFISGMKQQQPEINVEHGRLTTQYLNAEKLGLEGPLTPLQNVALQRFNQAANDLARMPAEWQLTGDKKQKQDYAQQTAIFQQYSEGLLREISKTKDAPAVELSLLQAHRDIRMQQFLTAHPDVEQALMNIKSPKLWWERLKPYFAGSGYFASGTVRNIAFSHATGVLATAGAPLAAAAIGGMRAYNRSQETLRDRDRLARKGAKDTSAERLNVQDVESEVAGGQAGLVIKLENLKQRFETETDPVKRADLQARLRRRIDYTGYKLDKGLVNFGTTDERVVNHYRLMQTMGSSMESLWSAKPKLKPDQYTALEKKHYDVSDKLEHFMENQLSRIKTERKRYIFWQTMRGAVMAGGLAYIGHLLTAHADQARPDHSDALGNGQDHDAFNPEHLRQTAAADNTAITSPFQTVSQTNSLEADTTHLSSPLSSEHFTEQIKSGDSVWKATERLLSDRFKDKFQNMNEAQRTYLIDAIKDKIQAHPEQFGLHAGQSIDQIQVGQTLNFDAVMKDHAITDLLFDHAKALNPEQMASIVHNNEILHHWISANPGEALTADNVETILQGMEHLGITPQALDQAIADGGSKVLSIDQGLSSATTTEIVNQILYGHPHGHEALMTQIKEALHETNYLDSIDKAHHYDAGQMTAGWLRTDRGHDWLQRHDGEVWQQDGAVYTVVKDVPAKTAKSLLTRAYEAAKDQLESAGIPEDQTPELVSSIQELGGKPLTIDAVYRLE